MPIAMQRKKVSIGLFGTVVNSTFNYVNYFSMIPTGSDAKPSYTKGFLDLAVRQNPKPKTVAIVAADVGHGLYAAEGARENVKAAGLTVVYDRRYPSTTTDLVPVVRAIVETNPDIVIVCSYPPDSVGMVPAVYDDAKLGERLVRATMMDWALTVRYLGPSSLATWHGLRRAMIEGV